MTATMTADHPAWTSTDTAHYRVVTSDSGPWLATWDAEGLALEVLDGTDAAKPATTGADASQLPAGIAPPLAAALAGLGQVTRLANPSLWDAVTTAILRQIVKAAQAKALYRRWCHTYGQSFATPAGPLAVAPTPQQVLEMTDDQFADVGAKLHRIGLQAGAAAVLEHGPAWSALPAAELAAALTTISRVGPWTARAAAADYTGDYSIYPHGDLAVRTWADRAAPGLHLPDDERRFEAAWRAAAGDRPQHLHVLTLLTLTWGSHARYRNDAGADSRR